MPIILSILLQRHYTTFGTFQGVRVPAARTEEKAFGLSLQLKYRVATPPRNRQLTLLYMSKLIKTTTITSKLLHNSKMPAFTLYGSRGSTNTNRVRLTLAEGGFTDYELVLLNLQKGEQKVSDSFLNLILHIKNLLSCI